MTYERSIVNNLESCRVAVPRSVKDAAIVADITEGWSYEQFESTYHLGISDYDRKEIASQYGADSGRVEKLIASECAQWADRVGRKIMQGPDRELFLSERISRFISLHDPVLSDEDLAAKLKELL